MEGILANGRNGDIHNLTDKEVRLSAALLLAEYGASAEDQAAARLFEMREVGNELAVLAWGRILDAVKRAQSAVC